MYFSTLRTTPWAPTFQWVVTPGIAADYINRPHEDYPKRVPATLQAITYVDALIRPLSRKKTTIPPSLILGIHLSIFPDIWGHGEDRYRRVNVTVGLHRPPDWQHVPRLMQNLHDAYKGKVRSVEVLQEWYKDFETIHPFVDGNGRTGGVLVSCFAHMMEPAKGYMAVLQ